MEDSPLKKGVNGLTEVVPNYANSKHFKILFKYFDKYIILSPRSLWVLINLHVLSRKKDLITIECERKSFVKQINIL